ncbi:O-antigen/teichoic acid export membrane protein [Bacillus mesophilus]|uniref:Polysaccharide biosynthesis protein n=1 Tax=Bacillus mesophilus TaxID=1808955 RepID=A0A6M0QA94_9BACI|nr:polysaccharide biosynthesis protein [Bacillus mesophilus]MBM7662638.1 O-antigen/teichoic acid export membrane protein [Bacillus mesophilus]NEY73296.1 polysaccharide biosynthesis protein [Bacillus mesophilus]
MNTFLKGLIFLVVAAFIGECVEFFINLVLARQLGEHGMGLYMTILPSIFLVVILASLELPISISKFIAEKKESYHQSMMKHAARFAIKLMFAFIAIAFFIVPNVPIFDLYHPMVKWLFIILIPIVSFTSLTRGYFMGKQDMSKIALSNFMRKAVQLLLLVVIYQLFSFELNTSILIALGTLIGSELVVCIYLLHAFYIKWQVVKQGKYTVLTKKEVHKNLLAVSLPTTGMRLFHALTHAYQPFLIKAALLRSGVSEEMATEQFGLMTGVAMSIGFFPAFIAHSLLIALIPTVSEAYERKEFARLQKILQQVILITALYGIPAVVLFYFFADPLTHIFFQSSSATLYLQILWPYFLIHFFVIPMQAYLIGLGLVKDAFFHSVWSTVFQFILMFVLGSTHLQMQGVIIGMNFGAVLIMMLHYLTICQKIGVSIWLKDPIKRYY